MTNGGVIKCGMTDASHQWRRDPVWSDQVRMMSGATSGLNEPTMKKRVRDWSEDVRTTAEKITFHLSQWDKKKLVEKKTKTEQSSRNITNLTLLLGFQDSCLDKKKSLSAFFTSFEQSSNQSTILVITYFFYSITLFRWFICGPTVLFLNWI